MYGVTTFTLFRTWSGTAVAPEAFLTSSTIARPPITFHAGLGEARSITFISKEALRALKTDARQLVTLSPAVFIALILAM